MTMFVLTLVNGHLETIY